MTTRAYIPLALLVATLIPAAAAFCGYPDDPKVAASAYLERRALLKVSGPTTPAALRENGAAVRGKTVEAAGRIVGRSIDKDEDGATRVCLMLQSSENVMLFVDVNEDMPILRVGQAVRALVCVPAREGIYGRCKLDCIVLECDLPPDKQSQVTSVRLPAGQSNRKPTSAPPTEPATVSLQPLPAMPSSEAPVQEAAMFAPPPVPAGAQAPQALPAAPANVRKTIDTWKAWVFKHNRTLSDEQCELIVRWVIYYSAVSGVDHRLSFSMIAAESDFHPECLSHAGAMGLTQLMPCNVEDHHVSNPWNVQENIRGGIEHMADMLSNFRGRSNYEQFSLGLAAYNAGLGRVKRAGGIPNISETIHYVKRVGDTFYGLVKDGYP
jgi:hypothetical protein